MSLYENFKENFTVFSGVVIKDVVKYNILKTTIFTSLDFWAFLNVFSEHFVELMVGGKNPLQKFTSTLSCHY